MKNLVLLLIVAVVVLSGCMSTLTTTDGKLSYGKVGGQEKGEFTASAGYMYLLHPSIMYIGEAKPAQLDLIMAPELEAQGANAATNLTIKDGYTLVDYILSSIVPLVMWGTVEVTGTAVKQ